MSPAKANRLVLRLALQQSIDEPGGKSIPTTDPIVHVEFGCWSLMGGAVDPCDGAPAMSIGRVYLPKGGGYDLHLRVLLPDLVHHAEEGARVQFRFGCNLWSRDPQAHLEIFFVSN